MNSYMVYLVFVCVFLFFLFFRPVLARVLLLLVEDYIDYRCSRGTGIPKWLLSLEKSLSKHV